MSIRFTKDLNVGDMSPPPAMMLGVVVVVVVDNGIENVFMLFTLMGIKLDVIMLLIIPSEEEIEIVGVILALINQTKKKFL
ncbi:9365_t:CDS:2 [Entrophospora sp. SA101]|nr:9365_t:CDS:2 [Entrophospora sp. SA101]